MNPLNSFVSGTALDLTVFDMLVRISLILAVAWLLAAALRQRAAIRHAILLAGIVSAFVLPMAKLAANALSFPRWSIEVTTAATPVTTEPTDSVCLITTKTQEDFVVHTTSGATPAEATTTVAPCDVAPCDTASAAATTSQLPGPLPPAPSNGFNWKLLPPIALAAWAIVAALRFCGLALSLARLRTIVHRAYAVDPQPSQSLLACIQRRVELRQPPELRESSDVATPLAAGIIGNYILVPAGWTNRLSRSELYSVLCHEAAHLARRDHRVVILQELLASLLWFHPLVYLVNRALTRAREEICDNYAIRSIDRPAYCAALFRLAGGRKHDSLLAATSFSSRHWPLEERIRGILDEHRPTVTGVSHKLQLAIVAVAVSLCGLATMPTITAAESEQNASQRTGTAEPTRESSDTVRHVRSTQAVGDDVRSIRITNQDGNLALDPSSDDQLHIDAAISLDKPTDRSTSSDKLEDYITIIGENGVLTIAPRREEGGQSGTSHIDLTISVPTGLAIEAQSADGDIAVNQIESNLTLTVHDGAIAVKSSTSADLTATTHDGDIAIDTQALTGKTSLTAHTGSVVLSADTIRSDLSAQSFDGDVTIKASRVDGPLSAASNQGDVTVALTDSAAGKGEIALTTRQGDIVLSAAAARKVAANSAEGDIMLQLSGGGVQEGLAAATSEGDVVIAVAPKTNADLALMTRGGEITIEGKPSSGNMINTRLGEGGPKYAVVTNNGSIVIKTLDEKTPAAP